MTTESGDLAGTWAEIEAQLPSGWELGGLRCASTGLTPDERSEEWVAVASGPDGQEVRHQAVDPIAALKGLPALVLDAHR
jgi:hypothetical protein